MEVSSVWRNRNFWRSHRVLREAESLRLPSMVRAAWCGLSDCWDIGLSSFISGCSMEPISLLFLGFSAQLRAQTTMLCKPLHGPLSPSAARPPNHLLTSPAPGLETSKIKKFFPPWNSEQTCVSRMQACPWQNKHDRLDVQRVQSSIP